MSRRGSWLACTPLLTLLCLSGCAHWPARSPALDAARFADIDQAIQSYVDQGKLPGAVYRLERSGDQHTAVFGRLAPEPTSPPVSPDTLFDAASLTKVVVTATAVHLLIDEGKLEYEEPLVRHLPECAGAGRESITLRHLLTHTSGFSAGIPALPRWEGKDEAVRRACALAPTHPAGTFFRYSDVNFILLGALVERASGLPLDVFATRRIFEPLGMSRSGYLPLGRFSAADIAPTQRTGEHPEASAHRDLAPKSELRGVVHDPTARFMGGVAGHAGLFTTVGDLARFARMLLGGGVADGRRLLSASSIARLITVQTTDDLRERRSAGWDIDTPYSRPRGARFPIGSFGHTGFTGCILWIDPFSKTFYVFLSNRVYPDDKNVILPLYGELGTRSADAVAGFDFAAVPGALAPRPPAPTRP